MAKATSKVTTFDSKDGLYTVSVNVHWFSPTKRHPQGVKLRCSVLNRAINKLVFLVDNHDEIGFHYHPELPENYSKRISIGTEDWEVALEFFYENYRRIANE